MTTPLSRNICNNLSTQSRFWFYSQGVDACRRFTFFTLAYSEADGITVPEYRVANSVSFAQVPRVPVRIESDLIPSSRLGRAYESSHDRAILEDDPSGTKFWGVKKDVSKDVDNLLFNIHKRIQKLSRTPVTTLRLSRRLPQNPKQESSIRFTAELRRESTCFPQGGYTAHEIDIPAHLVPSSMLKQSDHSLAFQSDALGKDFMPPDTIPMARTYEGPSHFPIPSLFFPTAVPVADQGQGVQGQDLLRWSHVHVPLT
eukprot:1194352-Prorocentrum_minimum.AAC.2